MNFFAPNFARDILPGYLCGGHDSDAAMVRSMGGGLPRDGLLLFVKDGATDSIGLLVEHYDQLTTDQQSFFFADSETPSTWEDYATFYAAVSVESWFNDENVIGALEKGVAIYSSDTDRSVLNRALIWFGLETVSEDIVFNNLTEAEFNNLTEAEFNGAI